MKLKDYLGTRPRRSLLVLLFLTLLAHFLDSRGYLQTLEMSLGLDLMLQSSPSETPTEIGIVKITEDDYQNYFCGQSPLDGRGIIALVHGVEDKLHPDVIGVDLDTSDWKMGKVPAPCLNIDVFPCTNKEKTGADKVNQSCLKNEIKQLLMDVPTWPTAKVKDADRSGKAVKDKPKASRLVWAQVPGELETAQVPSDWRKYWRLIWNGEREESMAVRLQDVMGQTVHHDWMTVGVPSFPMDADGVVRRYRRRFFVIEKGADHYPPNRPLAQEMNSLPRAVAAAFGNEDTGHSSEDVILRFARDENVFNPNEANDFLPPLPSRARPIPSQAEIEEVLTVRPRRIVLIGGTYKGARDIYRTPLGPMPGIRLLAQALQTDLHENIEGISETGDLGKFAAELLAGLLLILLWNAKVVTQHLSTRDIFALSLGGIFAVFFGFSRVLFGYGIWLDSIAILVGVIIHQVVEEFNKIKEYEEKIEHKDCVIERLTGEP